MTQWSITESDIILSLVRGGSFSQLMVGSSAVYKESQHCITLGFSQQVKVDSDLKALSNEELNSFKTQLYCDQDPSKQKALVMFYAENPTEGQVFTPEVKAVELYELISHEPSSKEEVKSILYDMEVIKNLFSILSIDVDDQSPLSHRQSQLQIIKSITALVESEFKLTGTHSEYLNLL